MLVCKHAHGRARARAANTLVWDGMERPGVLCRLCLLRLSSSLVPARRLSRCRGEWFAGRVVAPTRRTSFAPAAAGRCEGWEPSLAFAAKLAALAVGGGARSPWVSSASEGATASAVANAPVARGGASIRAWSPPLTLPCSARAHTRACAVRARLGFSRVFALLTGRATRVGVGAEGTPLLRRSV